MPNTELQFHMPPRDIIDFACTVISQISQKVGMKEKKKGKNSCNCKHFPQGITISIYPFLMPFCLYTQDKM